MTLASTLYYSHLLPLSHQLINCLHQRTQTNVNTPSKPDAFRLLHCRKSLYNQEYDNRKAPSSVQNLILICISSSDSGGKKDLQLSNINNQSALPTLVEAGMEVMRCEGGRTEWAKLLCFVFEKANLDQNTQTNSKCFEDTKCKKSVKKYFVFDLVHARRTGR